MDVTQQLRKFTWRIENFSGIKETKLYSEIFYVGREKWRLVIFPKGNNVDHLSIYVDVADSESLACVWSRYAQFRLSVINQIDRDTSITKDTQHQFNARRTDCGFTSFMPLGELYDPSRGFLVNDTCMVEADVAVCKVADYWSHDSKKETGYVGLRNQRAHSYMNTLLQTLYHIPYFRKAVYHMPTTENGMPSESIPLALQTLFYKLQYSDSSVATKELTKSFGLDIYDSFGWHGLQELNRVLCEKLEDKMKINNRYEFPLQLDLDRENGKYLSPEADRSVRNLYTLHSVLVHSGGVNGGHYYAYIRPTLSDQWHAHFSVNSDWLSRFKFDDERVTKEDLTKALEEQYGGEEELPQTNPGFNIPFKFTRYSNAYMLVYIRERDRDKIICNVDEKDIPEHFRIRLKKEQEEKEQKRREKEEAHLYTVIKVARDADLAEQIGRDIYFDLVNHDKVHSFHIRKQMPFNFFKEAVAKEFGIPLQYQRFWLWAKRMNRTYRPHQPLTSEEEAQLVGQVRELSNKANKANNAELKLFLEVELGQDLRPVPLPKMTEKDILLFFKFYDPFKEELRYVGRMFVKGAGKPIEILSKINKMAGFGLDEEIELYEEIKFEPNVMCERIDKMLTFHTSQLENGDIICFQKSIEVGSEQCRYPDVPSFLEYVHNCCQVVRFRSLEQPKEDEFSLKLSKLQNYDDVVQRVADHLGVEDPSKIRLTSHNCYSQQPKSEPIEYRGVEKLSEMLTSDILYYEVLDINLLELQGLKISKVDSRHAIKDGVSLDSKLITKPKEIMTPSPAILGTPTILSNSRVQDTAESTYRLLPIAHTSSRKETTEPEDGSEEDIDKFFTSLESELESCNIDSSEEAAEEALATMEEALNMAPANFYDSGKFYPLKKAFKILSSFGCSSTALTMEQKTELLAMEENFKELPKRVAKAVHDRNLLAEKESVKLTLTRNLERNLIKVNEATAEVTRLEQKITALHEQVDEAEKNKEKLLAEKKEIFRSSKGLKMELEALGKELVEYEAQAKVAEVEEKIVEAEWGRMKAFISSIKGKIKGFGGTSEVEGTASSTTGSTTAAVTCSGCSSSLTGFSSTIPTSGSGFLSTFPTVTITANGFFGTTSATTGTGSIFGSTPSSSNNNNNNDQIENVIAEDRVRASPTLPTFSQRPISPSASGFLFGASNHPSGATSPSASGFLFGASNHPSGATSFQFGRQPSIAAPQNQSPFLASGSVEFGAGGSFSLGTGGSDKSGRKFVKVCKQRKKKV